MKPSPSTPVVLDTESKWMTIKTNGASVFQESLYVGTIILSNLASQPSRSQKYIPTPPSKVKNKLKNIALQKNDTTWGKNPNIYSSPQ